MMSGLYCLLLWLHPPDFRRTYGDEMRWLFDLTVEESGATGMLIDAWVSVLRQWLLRSRVWLLAAALAGALFPMFAGNAFLHLALRRVSAITTDTPEVRFILTVALTVVTLAFMVIAAVIPVMRARRRA